MHHQTMLDSILQSSPKLQQTSTSLKHIHIVIHFFFPFFQLGNLLNLETRLNPLSCYWGQNPQPSAEIALQPPNNLILFSFSVTLT